MFVLRKLVWFTTGFVAACVLGVYIFHGAGLVFAAICSLVLGVLCLFLKKFGKQLAMILLGLVIGFGWLQLYESAYLQNARSYDGKTVDGVVEITDYSFDTNYGVGAEGRVELDGKTYRILLYISDVVGLAPAEQVQGTFHLGLTTAGGSGESTYRQGNGIILVGYAENGSRIHAPEKLPLRYYPAVLRKQIVSLLNRTFPLDTLAFARALLLGDTELLTYEEDTAFKLSGIRHVVAVSGLHVSILFSLVYTAVGKRRYLSALLGLPVLLLFCAVAGFSPSVVRACTMQALMILAMLFRRDYDPPTALCAALLVILGINPLVIQSVSLQLSAGCMIGIFLFSKPVHDWLLKGRRKEMAKGKNLVAKLIRWSAGSASVSLSAMVVTTPLCAWYFGTISLAGILTNILTLWMISGIFYGIMLACVLGCLWLPAGAFVGMVVSWPIRLVQLIALLMSKLPLAAVYTCSDYIVAWLIFCYVLIGILLLQRKKKPMLMASCVILSLLLSVGLSHLEPVMGGYIVSVIDVGQGQSILLRGRESNYLVDCGSDQPRMAADRTAQLLLSQGISSLDGIIVTHYDGDHVSGVEMLMHSIDVKTLYLPDAPDTQGYKRSLMAAFDSKICWVKERTVVESSDSHLRIYPAEAGKEGNESSLCVLFQRDNCDILITGDRSIGAEAALLAQARIPELELLVAGHHGSSGSTGFELLQKTRPKTVAISVGADNPYGHPSQKTMDRLTLFGCRVRRTDMEGTIHFRR